MSVDNFLESLDAQLTGFHVGVMQNRDLASRLAEQLDHRLAGQLAPLIVVGGNMTDDFAFLAVVLDVVREDGNAGRVRLDNRRPDGPRIARIEHDRPDSFHDEFIHLILLLFHVIIRRNDNHVVAVFFSLGFHAVGNDFEERICQCEG